MANHVSHASLPYPIKNARFTIQVPYLDADGDPTDPTTPDTEVSQDGGAFADAAEEVTTISGSNGLGYITLTGAETNNSMVGLCAKVASGPKATIGTLYPKNLAIVGSGTLSAGSAGGGTLGTALAYDVTGCFIRTTGGTGGGGTGGANNQARRIITYTPSTGAFTVSPNWETTPDNTTTYDVLLPEGVTLGMLKALNPTTPGNTLDVTSTGEAGIDWGNIGNKTTTNALTGTTIATTQQVDVNTIKTQAVTCAAGVTIGAFVGNATAAISVDASGKLLLQATQSGVTIPTVTTVTNQLTAAQIATGVWQDSTAGDFTAANSIGKSLYTSGVAPGASGGLLISGSNAGTTTFAGLTVSGATTFTGAVTASSASNNIVGIDVAKISGDATAADNCESFFDGTGYAGTNNVIPTVTTVTNQLTAAAIGAGVWDLSTAGHTNSGTFGAAAVAAGGAGDPWSTLLPGSYGAGTAGKIVGDNLNATVSSRLPTASYTAPDNSTIGTTAGAVALVKAKTDLLPNSPAATGDAMTLTGGERNSIAAALLDLADGVETNETVRQTLRLLRAAMLGKSNGFPDGPVHFRDKADAKDRITATVDADGNRTAVTVDAS